MSKVIFKDATHQSLFEEQGYMVLPFLDDKEVDELDKLFDSLHPEINPSAGFVAGSYSSDMEYKLKASNEIVAVFSKHYERLFTNYQPFGAAFLYKMPSENSQLSIHQDWTIVDEEKFVALNCWVPLTDVDASNGALHVVPGTHYNKIKTLRAPTLPFFFSGNDDVVERASLPMYVKAGEAVILNQSVIHYSPPNKSSKIRKAITAGVKSKDAPMLFHYKNLEDSSQPIEQFSMPENFLIGFDNFMQDILQRPKMGTSNGFVEFDVPNWSREKLERTFGKVSATTQPIESVAEEKQTIFQRISKLFSA